MSFNLADLFELAADTIPNNLALIAGEQRLSFAELDNRANKLANYFLSIGIKPGDKIGIHAFNRSEWVETMLAAFKVRAVPININFRYVEDELFYIYDNADLVALVYERQFTPVIAAIDERLTQLKHYIVIDDESRDAENLLQAISYQDIQKSSSAQRNFDERFGDDIYMLYTGGTTGMPKGAVWHHEDIYFGALQGGNPGGEPLTTEQQLKEKLQSNRAMTTVAPAPMMHGAGAWTALMTLISGGTYVLYCEKKYSGEKICQLLQDEKGMLITVVGDAMARPIADCLQANPGKYDLSHLFVLSSGGAILSKSIKAQLQTLLPNTFLVDGFGTSETGHLGSVISESEDTDSPCFTLGEHTKVLHPETLEEVEAGSNEAGILARSGHMPQGYYKDAAKTASTFKTDANGTRWAIPGDWAILETNGTARLLGRGSGCINSGGEKIFPEEVESALKSHPDVFDVAVAGVACEKFTQKVAAVVQPRAGKEPTLEQLSKYCAKLIARYKLPRTLILVDEVPRTPAGKPDYQKVKAIIEAA